MELTITNVISCWIASCTDDDSELIWGAVTGQMIGYKFMFKKEIWDYRLMNVAQHNLSFACGSNFGQLCRTKSDIWTLSSETCFSHQRNSKTTSTILQQIVTLANLYLYEISFLVLVSVTKVTVRFRRGVSVWLFSNNCTFLYVLHRKFMIVFWNNFFCLLKSKYCL